MSTPVTDRANAMGRRAAEEKTVDVRQILSIVYRRKWLIIIPLILVGAVAYTASFFLTPIYESSSIIWIDRPSNVSRELINIIGRDGEVRMSSDDRRRQLQALQNELTSQTYLYQLIEDLGLAESPELTRRAAKMREANPDRSLQQLKYHLLLERLRKQIEVGFVGTDQIRIAVTSTSPTLARDMVSRLAEIMEREKTAYELEKILDNQTFADLQLQKTEYEYNQLLDSLTAARQRLTRMQLPENIASDANRREILSDIDNTKLEISDLQSERESINRRLEQFGLEKIRLHFTDSLIELRAQIDAQISSYASMMEKYAWNEQNVINVNIRLNDNMRLLEREVARAVDRRFASYPENQRTLLRRYFIVNEQIDVLESKVNRLQNSLARFDQRLAALPRLESEIAELERRAVEARRYRDAFRSEETTVEILSERAKDRTKYKVIEPARVPLAPIWPDRNKIIVMGVLLGLVVGGGAVFMAEMLDKSFKRVEDAEEILQLPVLATVPKIEKLRFRR